MNSLLKIIGAVIAKLLRSGFYEKHKDIFDDIHTEIWAASMELQHKENHHG